VSSYAEREKERRKSLVLKYIHEHPGVSVAQAPHALVKEGSLGYVRTLTAKSYIYELLAEGRLRIRNGGLYPAEEAEEK